MQRSYILQAVFLTPLILMPVDVIIPGSDEADFALQRLTDTVIGGLIVILLGYLPLWTIGAMPRQLGPDAKPARARPVMRLHWPFRVQPGPAA